MIKKVIIQPSVLVVVVFAAFAFFTNNFSWNHWGVLNLEGDGLQVMAVIKSMSDGEIIPFGSKVINQLGAPFGAYWYDFPFEDALWIIPAIIAKFTDVLHAVMIYWAISVCLAACVFWYAGTALNYKKEWVFACAILFALSPYAFFRGVGHMNLTIYWHIPLMLYVLVYLCSKDDDSIKAPSKLNLVLIGVVSGLFSAYYLYPFLVLLGFVALGNAFAKNSMRLKLTVLVIFSAVSAFIIQHMDTFYFTYLHGQNLGVARRGIDELARYGLRLDDLLFSHMHRLEIMRNAANIHIQGVPSFFKGEGQSAYIGVVAIFSGLWLFAREGSSLFLEKNRKTSIWLPIAILIIALGIVGGLNYLLGAAGLKLFRATNRFSIFLLAIFLLFLCEYVSRLNLNKSISICVAFLVVILGLYDQTPINLRTEKYYSNAEPALNGYKKFAADLEKKFPDGGMAFQLPVRSYPEAGPIARMADYSHFVPYIFTQKIKYSYGTVKGRGEDLWQHNVANLPPEEMKNKLQDLGFSIILINKKAYADNGLNLIDGFKNIGVGVVADSPDIIAFEITPSLIPSKPADSDFRSDFLEGFFPLEKSEYHHWRWSTGSGLIKIVKMHTRNNSIPIPRKMQVGFSVKSIEPGKVWISLNGAPEIPVVIPGNDGVINLDLDPSRDFNTISFRTDIKARRPSNTDSRLLSFRVEDYSFKYIE